VLDTLTEVLSRHRQPQRWLILYEINKKSAVEKLYSSISKSADEFLRYPDEF